MSEEYVRLDQGPAPQLSREELARLTPDQIVKAETLGQLDVIKSGRTPTEHERRGERWATEQEQKAMLTREEIEANKRRADLRAQLLDGLNAMRD